MLYDIIEKYLWELRPVTLPTFMAHHGEVVKPVTKP